jgi:hypothetical protein
MHNNLDILFFQNFIFTYDTFTNLDDKLLNATYEPKVSIFTPYVFEGKKWMNSQPHSFTSISHVSNQSSRVTYNFSSFYK